MKPEPIRYLVNPILPRAMLTLLSATDKMGKTLLSMEIARAVVDGTDFLDHFPVEGPGSIAAFWLDDPINLTAVRLEARRLNDCPRLWVAPVLEVHLSAPLATIRDMESEAARVGADLVIIDALYLFMPPGREAGNDAVRMRPVMRDLNIMAERLGASVLLIAHDRKSGDDVAGSYVIRAGCKMTLRLVLPNGVEVDPDEGPTTPLRVLRMQGKLAPAAAWSIEISDDGWKLHGTQAEARAAATRRAVRSHLEEEGQGTVHEIARELGKRVEDVQRALGMGEVEGWAVGEKVKPTTRGRPRIIYRGSEFRSLATEQNCGAKVPVSIEPAELPEFRSAPLRGGNREQNSGQEGPEQVLGVSP